MQFIFLWVIYKTPTKEQPAGLCCGRHTDTKPGLGLGRQMAAKLPRPLCGEPPWTQPSARVHFKTMAFQLRHVRDNQPVMIL